MPKLHANRLITSKGFKYLTVFKGEKIEINEALALKAARRGQLSIKTKEFKHGQSTR